MNKSEIIKEIKVFLEGSNNDIKYLVNLETNKYNNIGYCVIHEPNKPKRIEEITYEPFLYMKDLSLLNMDLYVGSSDIEKESAKLKYGITITRLNTGNQKRLEEGYVYKISSNISYNSIINFLSYGGINPFSKVYDEDGAVITDTRGQDLLPNRDLFYNVSTNEQFLIYNKTRFYKGFEDYDEVHRVIFDIETTGLRYEITRIFAIGIRDNRGFEKILKVDKENDNESELKIIKEFFNYYTSLEPAVLCGYNSEFFDFEFILGRAAILGLDVSTIKTTLSDKAKIYRRLNASFKYGGNSERYTATNAWGISIIDTFHAVKRAAEINKDIKETNLEYMARFSEIAKENRTYVEGEDNNISKFYFNNQVFLANEKNEYIEIPDEFQVIANEIVAIPKDEFRQSNIGLIYKNNPRLVDWIKSLEQEKKYNTYITGRELVVQYLLDDLWETEQVDYIYSQSSFLLTKLVPTTYQRVSTMGTAAIWNLILTAWSYENDLAIPIPDISEKFSGGLARTFRVGYTEEGKKLDFNALYPMIQLTYDVFPIFDITAVIKKILIYMTSTRNIYKNLANNNILKEDELELLHITDHTSYNKYINNEITDKDRYKFKVKQEPIKVVNNSLFGALGSHVSFNWSDNVCAGRITGIGRIQLRHAVVWFSKFGCTPLLAVTDGINFHIPSKTNVIVNNNVSYFVDYYDDINKMWKYGDKIGIDGLITKFNKEELVGHMGVDDDGSFKSCLNLSRINYAISSYVVDKKTGKRTGKTKIKLTGNTIKSKILARYIEEFLDVALAHILNGDGVGFIKYYYDYVDKIKEMKIPLIKIASKKRFLINTKSYENRGVDINGRGKAKQAHMELIIQERKKQAKLLFELHKKEFNVENPNSLSIEEKMKLVDMYMPPEPELDSMVYYYNTGTKKSHADSKLIINDEGEEVLLSKLIDMREIKKNPNMTGEYNYQKYIAALNNKVKAILVGFDVEIRDKILVKIDRNGNLIKNEFKAEELILKDFEFNSLDDTLYLEELEVDYWNKTGYDPRLIWNGFKLRDNNRVIYGVYESALEYLNNIQKSKNKPPIRSINDKLEPNEYVLIKEYENYSIGKFNGVNVDIVKTNVNIPKSKYDEEYFNMMFNRYDKEQSEMLVLKIGKENTNFPEIVLKSRIFTIFKKKYKLDDNITLDLINQVDESREVFNKFYEKEIKELKKVKPKKNVIVDEEEEEVEEND